MTVQDSRRLRETLILITLYMVPGLISPGVFSGSTAGSVYLATIVRNVAYALLVLYLTDIAGETRAITGPSGPVIPYGLLIGILLFALSIVVRLTGEFLTPSQGLRPFQFDGGNGSPLDLVGPVFVLLSVAVTEEVVFRGYLLLRLQQLHLSPATAIVTSALIFAAGHWYQGFVALAFSFSAALFLGILWKRKPGILAFSLGHGLYNVVAFLWTGIQGVGT